MAEEEGENLNNESLTRWRGNEALAALYRGPEYGGLTTKLENIRKSFLQGKRVYSSSLKMETRDSETTVII
jgi:hypothetical protein